MPRGDGTGPEGLGPRTGRGLGTCPNPEDKQQATVPVKLGLGRGGAPRGLSRRGRGRRALQNTVI